MKAAVLRAYDVPLEIEVLDDPTPGPREVVVDVRACGVCGSDLFLQKGGFDSILPIVPGHEAAGIVSEVGSEVGEVAPGQLVAVYYIAHCGECRFCTAGRPNICLKLQRMGLEFNGGFAEKLVVPVENLIVIEPELPAVDLAVLTDAVATPYHALRSVARAAAGETVVVFGIGGIGSNAVQVARHLGCRTVAVSRSRQNLDLALELGAEHALPAGEDLGDLIADVTGPSGPDVVVQTVGSATVDEQAVDIVGAGGRVVLIGASTERFCLRSVDLIWREAAIHGSRGFTPQDIRDVIDLYRQGTITTAHLTRHTRPLEEINAALTDLQQGNVLRSVIVF